MRVAVAVVLLLCAWCVFAVETAEQFDARIEKELRAIDPGAADVFVKANAARTAEKHQEAIQLYAQVYARVPTFVHALRRGAYEQLILGDRAGALVKLREAVAKDRSPENLSSLATALVAVPNGSTPTDAEAHEARELAQEAVAMSPNDPNELGALAQVAIATQDEALLASTGQKLAEVAPNDHTTHVIQMNVAALKGDWDAAREELERAHSTGLTDAEYEAFKASLNEVEPFYLRWWKTAAWILAAWFAGFAVLLLLGAILSRAALRAAQQVPSELAGNSTGLSDGVRKTYAAVLFLSSIFYYLSFPIVIGLVLIAGGGLIYGFFALGHIPIKLVILIVIAAGISIWSMLKSLFIRRRDEDPGMRVELESEPRLRALLDDVAARIGTRAVDNVYLTPGTDVAVMERGKGRRKERCLILGVAALDGFALRPFKAVLGHEYGHFSNRDTAGGAFALSVRNSIHATAIGIAQGGAAAWYNPAWLFVTTFNRVFLRISQGASRLQEVLADRWAVFAYGADAFEAGLRHVVERGIRFDAHVSATLKEVVDGRTPLANLYTYTPSNKPDDVSAAIEEALQAKTSPYNSHPTPAERFALVHALPKPNLAHDPDGDQPAWSLFTNPDAVQLSMTAQVRANVRANTGIEIIAPATA